MAGARAEIETQAPLAAEEDRAYFEQRAEAEIALAQASSHPAVVRAHYLLAGYYLDRLYGQDNLPAVAAE